VADETESHEKEKPPGKQNACVKPDGSGMSSEFGVWSSESGVRRVAAVSRFLIICLFLFFSHKTFAQHTLPLDDQSHLQVEKFMNDSFGNDRNFHSAVKPYPDEDILSHETIRYRKQPADPNVIILDNFPEVTVYPLKRLRWNNYYHPSSFGAIQLPVKPFGFLLRPIYDFDAGYDLKTKDVLLTTVGGIVLDADYKQKIGIEARFAAGTSSFPNYLDSVAKFSGVMPGWGDRAYETSPGKYSFQHFSGNIIWRPSKIFNLQAGRDKHFWGDGYRSLFLSDISAAMPYVQQTTTIWKLQYTSLITWMTDWTHSTGFAHDFRNKFGTFHYLSFNAAKWLNLGVFESVVWQGSSPERTRGFDPNYLNPLIFFRPVEYSLGSSDNAMLGAALKIKFNSNNYFYSQILLDEFYLKEILARNGWWANKQGYQVGYKCFNFGEVKNLFMQTELNIVRPYTYSHGATAQNYSNAGMPLAHPLGANFAEMIGILSYSYKGLTVTGKLLGARLGLDTGNADYGQNIFISYQSRTSVVPGPGNARDYNHKLFDGVGTNIFYAEFKASYRFNTAFPLRIELLAAARSQHSAKNIYLPVKSSYIQLGLSLPLFRQNRDY
jgi:hypothetical protein